VPSLQQINLKIPPAVLDHWRNQAAAAGLSLRDWLVSVAGPAAVAASPDLLQRIEALEGAVARLQKGLQKAMPRPKRPTAAALAGPLPQRRLTLQEAEGLMGIAEVAHAVGVRGQSVTNWMERQPGGRPGAVGQIYRGHFLVGMHQLPHGGRPVWLWRRIED